MSLTKRDIYRFEEFELDPSSRTFSRSGKRIPVYPKAFDILIYLVANPGRVVTKEEIFKAVWPNSFVEESNLSQQVYALRRAMGDRSACIVTIPGRGYQFVASVEGPPLAEATPTSQTKDIAGLSQDMSPDMNPEMGHDIFVQSVRERTQVVIEESFPVPSPTRIPLLHRMPVRLAACSVLGLVLVAAAYLSSGLTTYPWLPFSKPPQLRKVLVADVLNLTGDPTFDLTMKGALTAAIEQTPWIQLMGAGEVNSVLTAMEKPQNSPLLGGTALEVCKRTGYQAMLRPKLEFPTDNSGYRLSMDVVHCGTGATLATYLVRARNKDELLGTIDSLSMRVRRKLGEPNKSLDEFQVPFYNVTTSSYEALLAYFQGVSMGRQAKFHEAITYFQKAAEIDPKFAWAQSALGVTYYNLGDRPKAAEYSQKAFDLSANVSEYEKIYLRYNYYLTTLHDLNATEKEVVEWTQVYPADMTAWEALTDVEIERGRFPQAIAAGEHALTMVATRASSTYTVLARAYMRANRLGDAKRILAEAEAQGLDNQQAHEILFSIAAIEHDDPAMQHEVDWNKGKPEFFDMLGNQAIVAADEGKYRQFEDIYKTTLSLALKEDGPEVADSALWEEIRIEAALGREARASELLKQVKDRSGIYGAVIEASAGEVSDAEAYLKKPEQYPHGTLEHFVYLSELKALLALRRHDPAAAIAALEPAAPYELIGPEVIAVRGDAYLAQKRGDLAEAQFRKLIANPGLEDPMHPWTVLAHLGLARALALEGNQPASKSEYENFFAWWKDADPDVPVLQQARQQYAQLR